ncbi:MAG: hypothetical protein FWG16_04475 [Micrococcales bacterium]|nr:hypothetical protein [Micrococcales bacterium]
MAALAFQWLTGCAARGNPASPEDGQALLIQEVADSPGQLVRQENQFEHAIVFDVPALEESQSVLLITACPKGATVTLNLTTVTDQPTGGLAVECPGYSTLVSGELAFRGKGPELGDLVALVSIDSDQPYSFALLKVPDQPDDLD